MNNYTNYSHSFISSSKDRDNLWISLDIVIPVYNEEKVINSLFGTLKDVFSSDNKYRYRIKNVRYIIVDDGSKDQSAKIICEHISRGIPAVFYRLSRNFGHQNAVSAGLNNADADLVAIIDADLQDPPEVILQMIAEWREGFDIVYGVRTKRKENFFKVASYWLFYRLLSFLSEIDIPLDSGDFCLLDMNVVRAIRDLPETLRHPRILRAWVGFRQTGIKYERTARKAGSTKYSFSKLYKLATDGVASASIRPLKISQVFSVLYLALLIALSVVILVKYSTYLRTSNEVALWFLFCYALIVLGSFIQTLCMYILSAYIGRSYLETKRRPTYLVMEVVRKNPKSTDESIDEQSESS